MRALFQGRKITRPVTESTFAEIRTQVDRRLEQFGVPGKIDEEVLAGLLASAFPARRAATIDPLVALRHE